MKLWREQEQSVQPATKAMYTPLIDMETADPDTMLTAMEEGQHSCMANKCGQLVTIFTNDQQLYNSSCEHNMGLPRTIFPAHSEAWGANSVMSTRT